ncbi:MAG: tail fiber domain-containing protein [Bacteroidetes bacterium]|nr:tail fiber domain-containing protein [Bacteroidota bacterium]
MRYLLILGLLITLNYSPVRAQSIGIGTDYPNPNAILDVKSTERGVLLPRLTTIQRNSNLGSLTLADEGLLIYNTTDLQFNYWDGSQWVTFPESSVVTANNGLNISGNEVRLGGTLTQNTTISQANFSLTYDLTGTGNFYVNDLGQTKFLVRNDGKVAIGSPLAQGNFNVTGDSYFSNDLYLREGNVTSGDILGRWYDESDDGVFDLYRDNNVNIRLHANGETVFNERAASIDFRVETALKRYALMVDGDDNLVRIGNTDLGTILFNGAVIDGITLDYVADFQAGTGTGGTAIGIGSREFIFDAGSDILATNASIFPVYHLTQDIGRDSMLAWDDVYADAFIVASDERLKRDVKNIEYGLKEIMQIKPVSYIRTDDPFSERKLGILAQQALPYVKEAIKTHNHRLVDETNHIYERYEAPYMGVEYMQLVPVLIKATQEQQAIINQQKEEIVDMKTKYDQLLKRIEQLENGKPR